MAGHEDDHVWGTVYRLSRQLVIRSDGDRSVVDRIEGHRTAKNPENYEPVTVTVELDGDSVDAITYVGLEEARRRCHTDHGDAQLRPDYVESVLEGAKASSLPSEYIAFLERTLT